MTPHEAHELLADCELVPVMEGALSYIKEIRDKCLEVGIPVALGEVPGKG